MRYDDFLRQAKAEMNAWGQNFTPSRLQGGIMTKWAKEPIEIPGMGMYIGSYCLWDGKPLMRGSGMLTSFETNENTGLPEFIKEGDWFNNLEHGFFKILYGDRDVVSNVHMKKGLPLPSWTTDERKGEGDVASQYIYSNGRIYNGDLIFKNGRIRPPDALRTAAARASVAPPPRGHSNIVGEKRSRSREVLFPRNIKRSRSRGGNATKKSKTNKRNRTNKRR
jgi:hypothetical protein